MMSKEEYREFLRKLFDEYIRDKIERTKVDIYSDKFNKYSEQAKLARLAMQQLQAPSLGKNQNKSKMKPALEHLRSLAEALEYDRDVLRRCGLFDVLDKYLDQIAEKVGPEDFPDVEREVLRKLGSNKPDRELAKAISDLQLAVFVLSKAKEKGAEKTITHVINDLWRIGDSEKDLRPYLPALVQIGSGVFISLQNLGLLFRDGGVSLISGAEMLLSVSLGYGQIVVGKDILLKNG
jgi:hypothetical protein